MMSDDAIATALTQAIVLEKAARAHWQIAAVVEEREAALVVVRQVTPVIRALEEWVAVRAALQT